MKLTSIYIFLFSIIAIVAAAPGPNAERLARGLSPLPPRQFSYPSRSETAKRSSSSSSSGQCNTGSTVCCQSEGYANDGVIPVLLGLLGIVIDDLSILIGAHCSPLTVGGTGSASKCTAKPLCCKNNNFNGLVAIGCTPININP